MVVTEASQLSQAGSARKRTLRVEKIRKDQTYSVADITVPMVPPVFSNIVLGTEVSMIVVCASESEIRLIRKRRHFLWFSTTQDQHRM